MLLFYIIWSVFIIIFSYGYVDSNLTLSQNNWYFKIHQMLRYITVDHRLIGAVIFVAIIVLCWWLYIKTLSLNSQGKLSIQKAKKIICAVYILLALSYPFTSYDLFNYIMTAKVTFKYQENPYITMPTEILNEPGLAYTRAANKTALYGPMFIAVTYVPYKIGGGNIWQTIIMYKLMMSAFGIGLVWMIWKISKSVQSALWFGLNPLVLLELAANGHNDVIMMLPAIAGVTLLVSSSVRKKIWSWALLVLSILVKGVTAFLIPLFFLPLVNRIRQRQISLKLHNVYKLSFWILVVIFFVAAPIREELYPWYAVWFLSFAALLPENTAKFERGLSLTLSFGLELRHIPYMAMGFYGGIGPMARFLVSFIPLSGFILYQFIIFLRKNIISKTNLNRKTN
jgi:hypothetical protein